MKVVVIGAGLSGLAAAHRLQMAGHEVQVLEALARPGGMCAHVRRHGFVVDTCPEIAATSYARYWALARSVGLGDEIVTSSAVVGLLRGGRMIDIDTSSLVSMLRTPALSAKAKFQLLWGAWRYRKLLRRADASRLVELAGFDEPTANAETFAVRAFGREVADYLIDPLMRTIGGTHMSQISALVVAGGVSSFSSPMVTLSGGLYRLPEAVAARLDVIYRARVEQLVEHGDGVEVRYVDADDVSHELRADACIIATQYDDATRLYPRLREIDAGYGEKLRFVRLLDIKLGYSIATHSKAYVAQVPTIENAEMLMFALSHNKAPDRAPPGHSLFTVYTDEAVWERFSALDDDAVIAWARAQMEALYPEVRGHFVFGHVEQAPRTACLADPGFYRRTAALLDRLDAPSRVQLAGHVFGAGSMEVAVLWGERAADRLLGSV